MTWAWNWLVLPFAAGAALDAALASLVYRARPRRLQNRLVALVLLSAAITSVASGARLLVRDPAVSFALLNVVLGLALGVTVPAYLLFCSTLPTRLAAPLRHTWSRVGVVVGFLALDLTALAFMPEHGAMRWADPPGVYFLEQPSSPLLGILLVDAIGLYLVAVPVAAWRASASGVERSQLGLVSAAFALLWSFYLVNGIIALVDAPLATAATVQFLADVVATLGTATLLGYAILRTQVFDVDVRLRWTVSRGTLVAIFLGVFFVVAQIAQGYLQQTQGYVVAGVATGALLLAIRPLERLADRVANAAVPGAARLSRDDRSRVYLEAAREAWADGSISRDERAMLDRTRTALGITADEALRLEGEAARDG